MAKQLPVLFLQQPVAALPVSEELKAMARINHLQTLEELLRHPLYEIPFLNASGYRLLKELIDLLEDHGYPVQHTD